MLRLQLPLQQPLFGLLALLLFFSDYGLKPSVVRANRGKLTLETYVLLLCRFRR